MQANESTSNVGTADPEPNEIRRFEQLRNELIELEKRVKRSADQSAYEEVHSSCNCYSCVILLRQMPSF